MSPIRPDVTLVGRLLEEEDQRLRDFLTRAAQPFKWVEWGSPEGAALLKQLGAADAEPPVLVDDTEVMASATVSRVAQAWMIDATPSRRSYDLAIVGAGPAGLAAAVYAASDGLSTLVLEEDLPGGQASYTSMIENFFGFPEGIGGAELARLAGRQAERFGAELAIRHGVTSGGVNSDGRFELEVDRELRVEAQLMIASPGMVWRRLDVEGVDDLLGRGIYYGAGRSEAMACEDRDVIVVGGGNSAGQAAMHLATAGARVTMLVRGRKLARSMSAYLVQRIESHSSVQVQLESRVEAVLAGDDGRLEGVEAVSADGRSERLPAQLMFLCLGGTPRSGWANESGVLTDPLGYILTGLDLVRGGEHLEAWPLERDPLPLETSVPGLFAAGDVRHGSTKRVGGAVGEGAMAVAEAELRQQELDQGTP